MGAVGFSNLCLAGYIACVVVLNLIAYLISAFYRRKFGLPVLQAGFLVAICSFILFEVVLAASGSPQARGLLPVAAVIVGSAASAFNALRLYSVMNKARK